MKSEEIEVRSLGTAITAARIKKGMTQRELAKLIGVHYDTIYVLEKDTQMLNVKYLKQISEILDIDLGLYDDYYHFAVNTSDNIRALRAKLGMSRKELADRIKINTSTVTNWENGKTNISRKFYQKLKDISLVKDKMF